MVERLTAGCASTNARSGALKSSAPLIACWLVPMASGIVHLRFHGLNRILEDRQRPREPLRYFILNGAHRHFECRAPIGCVTLRALVGYGGVRLDLSICLHLTGRTAEETKQASAELGLRF